MKFHFNIPNRITLIRVGLIPLFALVLLADIPYRNYFSAFIFIMLSVSDAFDGYFARKKKQATEFGALIDPIADKLLISTALIILIGKGVELWMAMLIIGREVLITLIRIYLIPMKISVPASVFGKAKTVVQSIAIAIALLQLDFMWYPMLVRILMLAAVLLTVFSGIEYLARIRKMTGYKIVNLPNLITFSRFVMIIPFAYYFLNSKISLALLVFCAIIISDKLDGISARVMNQKTELGSGFDSFTDWTLIITTVTMFIMKGYLDVRWLMLFSVPALVSGILKMFYAKKLKVVPVTFVARFGVGMMYTTTVAFLINFAYKNYILLVTVIIIYFAMIGYIFKALSVPRKSKLEK